MLIAAHIPLPRARWGFGIAREEQEHCHKHTWGGRAGRWEMMRSTACSPFVLHEGSKHVCRKQLHLPF